jgi:hypothetical protein
VLVQPNRDVPEWFALIGKNEKKYALLAAMQNAHDNDGRHFGPTRLPPGFESRMEKVAGLFGLTYKAPGASLRT